ncbi:hypothetical protein ACFQHW_06335 [Lapidilactobacillus achengensis]|uniref:Uncharacterized protein n=1 Tax=Lapidilactobacillus achengensis TaxID=2486000 RepID=A0ABW1UNC2_9LACO|nr:hypothetical protein [Lapidilactobacillus achengensis]
MAENNDELTILIEQAEQKTESIEEYRKIIRIALGKWLKNLQAGDIKLNSVHDAEVLMSLDLELQNKLNE